MEGNKIKVTKLTGFSKNKYLSKENYKELQKEPEDQSKETNNTQNNIKIKEGNSKNVRNVTAYSIFRKQEMTRLKNETPMMSGRELFRLVAKLWTKIKDDPSSKQYYDQAQEETIKNFESNKKMPKQNVKKTKKPEPIQLSIFYLF
jgi:hypothetical protein